MPRATNDLTTKAPDRPDVDAALEAAAASARDREFCRLMFALIRANTASARVAQTPTRRHLRMAPTVELDVYRRVRA